MEPFPIIVGQFWRDIILHLGYIAGMEQIR
jgi:hypothetical protein